MQCHLVCITSQLMDDELIFESFMNSSRKISRIVITKETITSQSDFNMLEAIKNKLEKQLESLRVADVIISHQNFAVILAMARNVSKLRIEWVKLQQPLPDRFEMITYPNLKWLVIRNQWPGEIAVEHCLSATILATTISKAIIRVNKTKLFRPLLMANPGIAALEFSHYYNEDQAEVSETIASFRNPLQLKYYGANFSHLSKAITKHVRLEYLKIYVHSIPVEDFMLIRKMKMLRSLDLMSEDCQVCFSKVFSAFGNELYFLPGKQPRNRRRISSNAC